MGNKKSLSEVEIRYVTKKNENWYKFIDAIEDDGLSIDEAVELLVNEGVSINEIKEIISKYKEWF